MSRKRFASLVGVLYDRDRIAIGTVRIRLPTGKGVNSLHTHADCTTVGREVSALITRVSDARPVRFKQFGQHGNCVECGRVAPYRDATSASSYR